MARSKKKGSSKSNPYAGRGLDKYFQVISELTARREKLAAQIGATLDDVRFVSTGSLGEWKPIYPLSAVHSSASSSPKSGSRSPSPSTLPSTLEITENKENCSIIQQPPTEDIATVNTRDLFSRLSFSFSLLGLMGLLYGVLYSTKSPLIALLFLAVLVILTSLYAAQLKSKPISSWVRHIFGQMGQFSRLRFAGGYDQDRKLLQKELEPVLLSNDAKQGCNSSTFEQNTLSSSQSGMPPQYAIPSSTCNSKPRASFPSRTSASNNPVGRVRILSRRKELPSPAFQESNATIQKPKFYSKLLPGKTRQREARSKMEMVDLTLGGSVSAANSEKPTAMEIKSGPTRQSRPTRNVARQDRFDDLPVMFTIVLTALASGIVPGIIIATISWFWLPILKGLIMAKDQGSSNVGAINRKISTSSKSKKVDQFSCKCKEDSTKSFLFRIWTVGEALMKHALPVQGELGKSILHYQDDQI
ncbi:hypothetical protein O6H91_22G013200 [Diphasiastrum complanatum]|uniref:Uncharacterized protein n=1 Tax=Diphasiastrum complanatum TaxID=34168 RepID=A0ACC2AF13_DIPCM|nr:hypothetical protein O6H91_22G013200 [Diphasiastrum complanatum]